MLARLLDDHLAKSFCYHMDVPFDETLRRHVTKANSHEFGWAEMASCWREKDLLPGGFERILTPDLSADPAAARILRDTALDRQPA